MRAAVLALSLLVASCASPLESKCTPSINSGAYDFPPTLENITAGTEECGAAVLDVADPNAAPYLRGETAERPFIVPR